MNDEDRVPGALSALADFGKSRTRVAEAGIIRRLGAARRRRRQAVVGAAGAATVAGAAAVALIVPNAADSGGYPSLVSGHAVAYRALFAGGGGDYTEDYLNLYLPDVGRSCPGIPLTGASPELTRYINPTDAARADLSHCAVALTIDSGELQADNNGSYMGEHVACPTWPAPPRGYVAARQVEDKCPDWRAGVLPSGTKTLGWLLISADGKASYLGVTPIAEPSPTANPGKVLSKSDIESLKNHAATSSP